MLLAGRELNVTSQGEDIESRAGESREAIELYLETWGWPEDSSSQQQPFWTTCRNRQVMPNCRASPESAWYAPSSARIRRIAPKRAATSPSKKERLS